jgi:hypothetical protein
MSVIDHPREIIVGGRRRGQWLWFVSEKEFWFLNLTRLGDDFRARGVPVEQGANERFGLGIVDEHNADEFLAAMRTHKVSTHDLRFLFRESMPVETWDDIVHLVPSLVVDFDARRIVSMYSEPASFERYVPEGWVGSYENLLPLVPSSERYWLIDGRDHLEELIGTTGDT